MLKVMPKLIIIIIALFMDTSYSSPNMRSNIAEQRSDKLNYKLTESVFPEHYTLKISPQFNNLTFKGYVRILIHVKIPTNHITLHQRGLNITKKRIYLTTNNSDIVKIKNAGVSGTKEQQFYTITFSKTLKVNTYRLHIPEFYGVLNKYNEGFYYGEYTDEHRKLCKFAMTQFESTLARYAFPCFDEPPFRAKFKIYIVRPSDYHSISNTKLIKSKKITNYLYEDEFGTTPPMPTYLVAYIVSKMKFSPVHENFYRILARPLVLNKNYEKYSLSISGKILKTIETYFDVKYSLNKMDQAIIPSRYFTSGGMENWGLVTYSETDFLPLRTITVGMKMDLDLIITHEFVHQWFGNLVTMKWWRHLWLKEGFATFFEYRITDMIKPEWKMMEQFLVERKQCSLELDGFFNTRDMNQDAGTPSEISLLYDPITYNKAASVIHMLETVMTPNVFKRGLTNYLRDRAFQSAIPNDLYRNLEIAMKNSTKKLPNNLTIAKIMATWDSQKGCPVVSVERNYHKNQYVVKLKQSRYMERRILTSVLSFWYIPINYATKSNPNFNDTRFSNWLLKTNESITIKNLKPDDWLILNKQAAYYYRVNYDVKNWKLINKALQDKPADIHNLNIAQLHDDSFHLAKRDMLDYEIPLRMSTSLYHNDNYVSHYPFIRAIKHMTKILRGSDVEKAFHLHVVRILKRSYHRLGHNSRANDTHADKSQRTGVVYWMGKFDYSDCRIKLRDIFYQWKNRDVLGSPNLEPNIMCNTLRIGNETDWDYLFRIYHSISNTDFKKNVFRSLGCTENVFVLQRFLSSSLSSSNEYNLANVVELLCTEGLVGFQVSINYVSVHFNPLVSTLGDQKMSTILIIIASKITTEGQLEEFEQLLKKHSALEKQSLLILENIRLRISRNKKRIEQISKFFDEIRSSGNLSHTIPNVFVFILHSSIIYCNFIFMK